MAALAPRLAAALLAAALALAPHADASALTIVSAAGAERAGRGLLDAAGAYGDDAPMDTGAAMDEPDMMDDMDTAPMPPDTEGNEGDEGNEGADDPNDGNEGNEGNEGDEGDEGSDDTPSAGDVVEAPEPDMASDDAEPTDADADAADAPDMASADAESTDDDAAAAGDPEWPVCVSGEKEEFGMVTGDQPDGITVYADGRCVVSEWAGGFDGYFSTEAGNDHEEGLATAAAEMLGEEQVEVGIEGQGDPDNNRVNRFLKTMREAALPLQDLDYPEDEAIADGGVRQANVDRVSAACTELITVVDC